MFVTNWISTTKIQKISEITNFFRHYFLSRTGVSGTCGNNGIAQTIVRLEHGEPDFGEATNPAGQGLWRVTPKVLSNSKHTLLCL